MKKRDRRLITPSSTSLTVGSDKSQKGLFDLCDAVPEGKAINMDQINEMIKMKKKEENRLIKESNDRDRTIQENILDAW